MPTSRLRNLHVHLSLVRFGCSATVVEPGTREMSRSSGKGTSPRAFTTFRRRLQRGTPLPKAVWIACSALVVLLVLLVAQSIRRQDALTTWRGSLEEGALVSWPEWDASWPLLQPSPNTPAGDLRGPYAFAARNADTLRYIPCYCGCVREGHSSVLNCFVRGFSPQGTPIWSDHGFTCPLCVNILREMSLMTGHGMSLPAMRRQIDEHHGSMFATSTSTPLPR